MSNRFVGNASELQFDSKKKPKKKKKKKAQK